MTLSGGHTIKIGGMKIYMEGISRSVPGLYIYIVVVARLPNERETVIAVDDAVGDAALASFPTAVAS